MTGRRLPFRLLALALTFAVAALPTPAFASGFQLFEQNASGLGHSYAGQAAGVKDASAVFFNPAALSQVPGFNIVLSVEPIGPSMTFIDRGSTNPTVPSTPPLVLPVAAGTAGGDAGAWTPVPNLYASWQAASRLWVGVGVNVPFGLTTEWDDDFVGRFHGVKSSIHTYNVNPTVAFKVNDMFTIGAGVSYQYLKAELSQMAPYGASVGAAALVPPQAQALAAAAIITQLGGPAGLGREGLTSIEGTSSAWGWNAGALVTLGENTRLAATYRSKIKHDVEGDVTFANAPAFQPVPQLPGLFEGLNARFANGPVKTTVEMPETISVAGSWEGDKVEVLADWTWTGWSSVQDLTVVRADGTGLSSVALKFDDTWRAALGFSYKFNDKVKVRLGAAYDKSPVQDEFRTPRLPDADRVWASTGVEYRLSQKVRFDLGYARIFIAESTSNLPNQSSPTATPQGALVGDYSASTNILGAQLTLSF